MNKYIFPCVRQCSRRSADDWQRRRCLVLARLGHHPPRVGRLRGQERRRHRRALQRDPLEVRWPTWPRALTAQVVQALAQQPREGHRQVRRALVPHLGLLPRLVDHRRAPGRLVGLPDHPQEGALGSGVWACVRSSFREVALSSAPGAYRCRWRLCSSRTASAGGALALTSSVLELRHS